MAVFSYVIVCKSFVVSFFVRLEDPVFAEPLSISLERYLYIL